MAARDGSLLEQGSKNWNPARHDGYERRSEKGEGTIRTVAPVSLKSLQDDHQTRETRARQEARAALARAEAEQRARVAAERESRRIAEQERIAAEELAREQQRARAAAIERAQLAAQGSANDERLALERQRAALELRLAEHERALELSQLSAQAAGFRDRSLAWLSCALCALVCAGALGLYYGKLRPEGAALASAQASALAAETRRTNEAESLLGELQRKNDALVSDLSTARDALRLAQRAAPPTAPPPLSVAHHALSVSAHHASNTPCSKSGDPLDPCLN